LMKNSLQQRSRKMSEKAVIFVRRALRVFAISVIPFFVLLACPQPFQVDELSVLQDSVAPSITISSPGEADYFDSIVTVTGSAIDLDDEGEPRQLEDPAAIPAMSFSVSGEDVEGDIEVADDGTFEFSFSTLSFESDIVVLIRAADSSGNDVVNELALRRNAQGPFISITEPTDSGIYLSSITLAGTVKDGRDKDSSGEVANLSYTVVGESIADDLAFDPETGEFQTTLDLAGINRDSLTLRLEAEDLHGDLTVTSLQLTNDGVGPALSVTSPGDFTYYSTVVELSGTVEDPAGAVSEVASISYAIPGSSIGGNLSFADGSFNSIIDTSNLSGNNVIEVTAEDLNGNVTMVSVTILKPTDNSEFPSFNADGGNGRVTLSWDPVYGATRYEIFNLLDGTTRIPLGSPYIWSNLTNGLEYTFMAVANVDDALGEDAQSAQVTAMPLSERTLAPRILASDYRSNMVEWNDIRANTSYLIERSVDGGPWGTHAVRNDTRFEDTAVSHGVTYTYRVYPMDHSHTKSSPASAVPPRYGRFPQISVSSTVGDAYAVDTLGSLAVSVTFETSSGSGKLSLATYVTDDDGVAERQRSLELDGKGQDVSLVGVGSVSGKLTSPTSFYAIVSAWDEGVHIVDVTEPRLPTVVGNPIKVSSRAMDAEVVMGSGTTGVLYVTNDNGEFEAFSIDFSDLKNTSRVGSRNLGTATPDALSMGPNGNYAYIASRSGGVKAVSITNAAPNKWPVFTDNTSGSAADARGLTISGDYLYVANGTSDTVKRFSIAGVNAGQPKYLGELSTDTDGSALDVAVAGGRVYIADLDGDIKIADTGLTSIERTVSIAGRSQGLAVHDGYVYVAQRSGGLRAFDSRRPSNPTSRAVLTPTNSGFTRMATAHNDVLFVADWDGGVAAYSLTDPAAPSLLGTIDTTAPSLSIATDGNYVYSVGEGSGSEDFEIIDASSPSAMSVVRTVGTPGSAKDIEVAGEYAFIADGGSGLTIVNISRPEVADIVTTLTIDEGGIDSVDSIAISGSYAYVTDRGEGLAVIDIADPQNPSLVSTEAPGTVHNEIVLKGDRAYVAGDSNGVHVYDISDPTAISLVTTYGYTSDNAHEVSLSGPYLFVGDDNIGLLILDTVAMETSVGDVEVARYTTTSSGTTVGNPKYSFVRGRYAYIAQGSTGLEVLELD
jgi:hypothetical protein